MSTGKFTRYSESVRVPFIVASSDKSRFPPGTVYDGFVELVDIAPTILGFCGENFADSRRVLGPDRIEYPWHKETGQSPYRKFRWVVIPHSLGADQPVIYALPPMNRSNVWPWESWYTDGVIPRIHHVHYTAETPLAKARWSESPGALQRPPEIAGVTWFWHDSASMVPALVQTAAHETLKE